MNFNEISEFSKEFKQLFKKYKSLNDDLDNFRRVLPQVSFKDNKNFAILKQSESVFIIKARLFCKYLKKSSLRIIFYYNKQEEKVEFIEIYFKGNKENMDYERVELYWENLH